MPRKKPEVSQVYVYLAADGFRYTCRDPSGKVVRDSKRFFISRRKAVSEIMRYWPRANISFETR